MNHDHRENLNRCLYEDEDGHERCAHETNTCRRCGAGILPGFDALCDDCNDELAQRQQERDFASYWSGDGPVTLVEQQEAARKLK